MADHGTFTRNGKTRTARTPAEAVRLKFTGWAPATNDTSADTGNDTSADTGNDSTPPPATGSTRQRSRTTTPPSTAGQTGSTTDPATE